MIAIHSFVKKLSLISNVAQTLKKMTYIPRRVNIILERTTLLKHSRHGMVHEGAKVCHSTLALTQWISYYSAKYLKSHIRTFEWNWIEMRSENTLQPCQIWFSLQLPHRKGIILLLLSNSFFLLPVISIKIYSCLLRVFL